MRWTCADESGCRVEIEAKTAQAAAEEYVATGDYGLEPRTRWITVAVWDASDDGYPDRCKVELPALAPPCVDAEHRFESPFELVGGIRENPGVWGSGGGVRIHEACVRCGCGRVTDTWAQDPSDGEQGLTSETYTPDAYPVAADLEAA